MEFGQYLACAMFLLFIGALFLGFPVAWTLGGLAITFTAIAVGSDAVFDTQSGVNLAFASGIVEAI